MGAKSHLPVLKVSKPKMTSLPGKTSCKNSIEPGDHGLDSGEVSDLGCSILPWFQLLSLKTTSRL